MYGCNGILSDLLFISFFFLCVVRSCMESLVLFCNITKKFFCEIFEVFLGGEGEIC